MKTKDTLVGKFFHTFNNGVMEYQGEILSCVAPGLYLVQLYEWLLGCPSGQHVEPVANMVGWKLYADREAWHRAHAAYVRNRGRVIV